MVAEKVWSLRAMKRMLLPPRALYMLFPLFGD